VEAWPALAAGRNSAADRFGYLGGCHRDAGSHSRADDCRSRGCGPDTLVADSDRGAVPAGDTNPKTYHFAAAGPLDAAALVAAAREAGPWTGDPARSQKVPAAPR